MTVSRAIQDRQRKSETAYKDYANLVKKGQEELQAYQNSANTTAEKIAELTNQYNIYLSQAEKYAGQIARSKPGLGKHNRINYRDTKQSAESIGEQIGTLQTQAQTEYNNVIAARQIAQDQEQQAYNEYQQNYTALEQQAEVEYQDYLKRQPDRDSTLTKYVSRMRPATEQEAILQFQRRESRKNPYAVASTEKGVLVLEPKKSVVFKPKTEPQKISLSEVFGITPRYNKYVKTGKENLKNYNLSLSGKEPQIIDYDIDATPQKRNLKTIEPIKKMPSENKIGQAIKNIREQSGFGKNKMTASGIVEGFGEFLEKSGAKKGAQILDKTYIDTTGNIIGEAAYLEAQKNARQAKADYINAALKGDKMGMAKAKATETMYSQADKEKLIESGKFASSIGTYFTPLAVPKAFVDVYASENNEQLAQNAALGFGITAGTKIISPAAKLGFLKLNAATGNKVIQVGDKLVMTNKIAETGTKIAEAIPKYIVPATITYMTFKESEPIIDAIQNGNYAEARQLTNQMEQGFAGAVMGGAIGSSTQNRVGRLVENPIYKNTMQQYFKDEPAKLKEFNQFYKRIFEDLKGKDIRPQDIDFSKIESIKENPKLQNEIKQHYIDERGKGKIYGSLVQYTMLKEPSGKKPLGYKSDIGDIDTIAENPKTFTESFFNKQLKNGYTLIEEKGGYKKAVKGNETMEWVRKEEPERGTHYSIFYNKGKLISASNPNESGLYNRIDKYSDVTETPQTTLYKTTPSGIEIIDPRTQAKLKMDGYFVNARAKDKPDLYDIQKGTEYLFKNKETKEMVGLFKEKRTGKIIEIKEPQQIGKMPTKEYYKNEKNKKETYFKQPEKEYENYTKDAEKYLGKYNKGKEYKPETTYPKEPNKEKFYSPTGKTKEVYPPEQPTEEYPPYYPPTDTYNKYPPLPNKKPNPPYYPTLNKPKDKTPKGKTEPRINLVKLLDGWKALIGKGENFKEMPGLYKTKKEAELTAMQYVDENPETKIITKKTTGSNYTNGIDYKDTQKFRINKKNQRVERRPYWNDKPNENTKPKFNFMGWLKRRKRAN